MTHTKTIRVRNVQDALGPIPGGGEALAARLPPPPPGRVYRFDPDGSGGFLAMIVTDPGSARTGDAPMTPAGINTLNRLYWGRQPGAAR